MHFYLLSDWLLVLGYILFVVLVFLYVHHYYNYYNQVNEKLKCSL